MQSSTETTSFSQPFWTRWRTKRQRPLRDLIPGGVLSFAFAFLLAIYGPLEIYFTNIDEFVYGFSLLMPQLLILFPILLTLFLAAFLISYLIHPKFYRFALAVGTIVYLSTYIQGMFLVGHLPRLDGTTINWSQYIPQHIQSIVLLVLVTALVGFLWKRLIAPHLTECVVGVAAFFTAVLLVTGTTVGIANDGFRQKNGTVCTTEGEFTLSTRENFIIFLVDCTDSATVQYLMNNSDPQFADTLEDFTYYSDMLSTYMFTRDAIPFIFTGQWYQNQEDFRAFTTRAYENSPLLAALKEQDYRIGVYEESLVFDSPAIFDIENVRPTEYHVKDEVKFLKSQLKLVWFKYAPFPLKTLVKIDTTKLSWLLSADCQEPVFTPNNQVFYEALPGEEIVTTEDKCFRFIHLEGAHVPFRYDRDVNLIDEDEGTYPQMVECSMTIVDAYLQKLKDAGVYDNSAIIVMADHGYGYYRQTPFLGRVNPLFAVKGMGEHHEMEINEAPVSFEDLQEAYPKLMDGAAGGEIFDHHAGANRPRRVVVYDYGDEEHMQEYYQMGKAWDSETMVPTGIEYNLHTMDQNGVPTHPTPPKSTGHHGSKPTPGHR